MITTAYVLVSFIGVWANFWFYRQFGLPIMEYMQGGDYLVAGLREPAYAAILLIMLAVVLLISWPDIWRRKHPARVEQLRRRWWGRLVFPSSRWFRWEGTGVSPETGVAATAFISVVLGACVYMQTKATLIRDNGAGSPVQVTLLGDAGPVAGQARLLGTSSAFVFLWWPEQRRAEAVPITSVRQMRMMVRKSTTVEAVPLEGATGR